jgi:hypothetical protein
MEKIVILWVMALVNFILSGKKRCPGDPTFPDLKYQGCFFGHSLI